jgi:hypothetical protein
MSKDDATSIEMKAPPVLTDSWFVGVTFRHCRLPASFVLKNNFEMCRWVDVEISDDFYGNTVEKQS